MSKDIKEEILIQHNYFGSPETTSVIFSAMEEYATIKVQEERQKGWVSVEDLYPTRLDTDKNGCLLGWDKFQEMAHKCKLEDIHQMKIRFTHWMPLPEPPKQ